MGEEKRHEMMETLFGSESEGSKGEEDAERDTPAYSDDEAEGGGEVEAESEGERAGSEAEKEESEAERVESDEAEREEGNANHSSSEGNQAGHQRRYLASESRGGRQQVSASVSERSNETGFLEEEGEEAEATHFHKARGVEEEEDEVEQAPEPSEASGGVAEMRDVFGDSDEEEQEVDDGGGHSPQARAEASPSDNEASVQRGIRPDDVVPDEEQGEQPYHSDEEHPAERRARERPVGSPLRIDIPFCPPPGHPDKMHVVRVSNIMGIESRPFNPKTYVEEEEQFVTDESGHKQRIRLEDNVARWRLAHNHDGSPKYESNARFVKWSDGSMQLLIGNEVLDISVQKAHQDQAHLFLRHGKGILQSQGRLLQKMKFMPSSLSSKSHRLLTALVDSRNRKIYKVKNVITNTDPEREKEETEKLQEKRIRSREDLQRKQEKISRKYMPVRERAEPQLSPGYLEGALEEEDEADDYPQGQRVGRFEEQLEAEGRAERRIMNAKRHSAPSRDPMVKRTKDRQPSPPPRRDLEDRFSEESEREASEYESEGQDEDARENEVDEEEEQQEEVEEEVEEDDEGKERWDDEDEIIKKRKDREDDSEHEASPPRKPVQRRRVVVSDSDED